MVAKRRRCKCVTHPVILPFDHHGPSCRPTIRPRNTHIYYIIHYTQWKLYILWFYKSYRHSTEPLANFHNTICDTYLKCIVCYNDIFYCQSFASCLSCLLKYQHLLSVIINTTVSINFVIFLRSGRRLVGIGETYLTWSPPHPPTTPSCI